MRVGTARKQPAEKFSYTIDYSEALTEGDNLYRAIPTVYPDDGELIVSNVGVYDPRVRFWVEGGIDGKTYTVTFTVETMDGRRFQDEVLFKIKEIV